MTKQPGRFYLASLNLIASVWRNFFGIIFGFIATPIILKYLGAERFGAYRVLLDLFGQLGILEFGLFTAILPIFAKSISDPKELTPRLVMRKSLRRYSDVIMFQILGAGVIYAFLPRLIPVEASLTKELRIGFFVLALSLFTSYAQVYRAFLDSFQRGYIISLLNLCQNIFVVSFSVLFAVLHWGIPGQALAYIFGLILSFAGVYIFSINVGREVLSIEAPEQEEILVFKKSLKEQRNPHFIAQLCGRLSFWVDNMFVSYFMGPATVTAFFLTQRAVNLGMQQLQQVGAATWPAMSELYYQGKMDGFRDRLVEVTEFVAFCSGLGLSLVMLINPAFVTLWTGPDTFAGYSLNYIVCFNAGLISINSFWLWCFTGTGILVRTLPMLYVQTAVNLIISGAGTYYYGMIGPVFGTLVSFGLVSQPYTLFLLKKEFEIPYTRLIQAWVWPFLGPTLAAFAITLYFGHPPINSWAEFTLWFLGLGLVFCITFPFVFIRPSSRRQVVQRLKRVIMRKLGLGKKD